MYVVIASTRNDGSQDKYSVNEIGKIKSKRKYCTPSACAELVEARSFLDDVRALLKNLDVEC